MKIAKIKKDFSIYFYDRFFHIKKKKQYIFPEQSVSHILNSSKNKIKLEDIGSFFEVEEKINLYNATVDNDKTKNVIIVRSGGFGDIIALSGLVNYLLKEKKINKVIIYTRHFYLDGLSLLFPDNVKLKGIYKDPLEEFVINNDLFKVVYFEGIIENSKENQYNLHYERIGLDSKEVDDKYKRPIFDLELLERRLKNKSKFVKDSSKIKILLVPRSTSFTRSIRLYDMINIVLKLIQESKMDLSRFKFYVHKENTTGKDLSDIALFNNIDIEVIEKSTIADFVLDVYNSDFIFSVDTAAIHLAEGFKLPAIALYNSFTVESRNKHYKYTKSIDVISECNYQPCFIHPKDNDGCIKYKELFNEGILLDKDISPCLDSRWNKNIYDYITENTKDYFIENVARIITS